MVLGWNFGDGHLNDTQLLDAVQAQCGFEPGEVRVVMVESQPLFGRGMHWKIVDAATGVLDEGETDARADARRCSPGRPDAYADALLRARPRAAPERRAAWRDRGSDAVVVGSGPNGLAAAIALARRASRCSSSRRADELGGGTRSAELTLPGFVHDVCSAVHPMGDPVAVLPRRCRSREHGLVWLRPRASVAHPLDDGPAVMLVPLARARPARGSAATRAPGRASSARSSTTRTRCSPTPWRRCGFPSHPVPFARFGLRAAFSANRLARLLLPRRARARAASPAARRTRSCR